MDSRLLQHYKNELDHLRQMGGEFAKEFPVIAQRLSLTGGVCPDPYVERLLEGFAFLAARVGVKLDAEFPRLTQSILSTVYPHYLAPTPSAAIVRFHPSLSEGSLAGGFPIPRGTSLRSAVRRGDQTACEFCTAHDVKLWPLRVTQAQYHTRDLASQGVPRPAEAGLRIRLECTVADMPLKDLSGLESLTFYLGGTGVSGLLYEQLFGRCTGLFLRTAEGPAGVADLGAANVRRVGFEPQDAILPYGPRSFDGYRLLQEYFTFPERFLFVEFAGLGKALGKCNRSHADLVVLFERAQGGLEGRIDEGSLSLFCTPAVNLFPRRADPIPVSDRFGEFHVVVDKTRPRDFEVHTVRGVMGVGDRPDKVREFRPFYSAADFEAQSPSGAYYVVHRVPRAPAGTSQPEGDAGEYAGSEAYVSLVDSQAAPYSPDLRHLSVDTLCTNRHLPLRMLLGKGPTDFECDLTGAPVESVRCVGQPSPPRSSCVEGEFAWRLISHLSLNYLSLADSGEREGSAALREILRLYGDSAAPHIRRQIDGVRSVRCRGVTRRVIAPGPMALARGIEVTVTLDETAFEGLGAFLLGGVLAHFFAKYVSMNSFTETVICGLDREIKRWPMKVGRRQLL